MTGKRASVAERLERNCIPEPNSGCWLWLLSVHPTSGYGQIMMTGNCPRPAHKVSYETFKGAVPRGLDVRHKCDVRSCINPEHLLVGTRKQNMEDCEERGRLARGFKLPHTKLSFEQVEAIRADTRLQKVIADKYAVTASYVSMLKSGHRSKP